MTVAIIDYGSGNLRSATKAFERAAAEAGIKGPVIVTDRATDVAAADRIVLPGVGAFGDCMAGLAGLDGVVEALNEAVIAKGRPFFGVCVGMQLLASLGREHGDHEGLDWIEGEVVKLEPEDPALKIPHMGWNSLRLSERGRAHPALKGIGEGTDVYFVHSYHFRPKDPAVILAETDYGGPVTAIVGRDNILGTQFHPEKSQQVGLQVIANFLQWRP